MGPQYDFLTGGEFILDAPRDIQSLWGVDNEVLWARGESLFIVGPPGVGKTTLISQLVMSMCGIGSSYLLTYPVTPVQRILYLASDRPVQIARMFARSVDETHRGLLDEHLRIWQGPPPMSIAKEPKLLLDMARQAHADVLILDSLKDMAVGLSDDDVGAGVNQALQYLVANGVDVATNHHNRKSGNQGAKPKQLEDVYGSAWLTAGAGSVLCLWGKAGDEIVELSHLKPPALPVGPLNVEHDHVTGLSRVHRGSDLFGILRAADGMTIEQLAQRVYETEKPTQAERKRVERQLAKLAEKGRAKHDPQTRHGGSFIPARWYAINGELDDE